MARSTTTWSSNVFQMHFKNSIKTPLYNTAQEASKTTRHVVEFDLSCSFQIARCKHSAKHFAHIPESNMHHPWPILVQNIHPKNSPIILILMHYGQDLKQYSHVFIVITAYSRSFQSVAGRATKALKMLPVLSLLFEPWRSDLRPGPPYRLPEIPKPHRWCRKRESMDKYLAFSSNGHLDTNWHKASTLILTQKNMFDKTFVRICHIVSPEMRPGTEQCKKMMTDGVDGQ